MKYLFTTLLLALIVLANAQNKIVNNTGKDIHASDTINLDEHELKYLIEMENEKTPYKTALQAIEQKQKAFADGIVGRFCKCDPRQQKFIFFNGKLVLFK